MTCAQRYGGRWGGVALLFLAAGIGPLPGGAGEVDDGIEEVISSDPTFHEMESSGPIVTIDASTPVAQIIGGDLATAKSLAVYGAPAVSALLMKNPAGQVVAEAEIRITDAPHLPPHYYLFWHAKPNEIGVWEFLDSETGNSLFTLTVTPDNLDTSIGTTDAQASWSMPGGGGGGGQRCGWLASSAKVHESASTPSTPRPYEGWLLRYMRVDSALLAYCGIIKVQENRAWTFGYDFWGLSDFSGIFNELGMATAHTTKGCRSDPNDYRRLICFETLNPEVGIVRGYWYACCSMISQESRDGQSGDPGEKVKNAVKDIAEVLGSAPAPWAAWVPAVAKLFEWWYWPPPYVKNYDWERPSDRAHLDYIYFKFLDSNAHSEGARIHVQWRTARGTTTDTVHGAVREYLTVYYYSPWYPWWIIEYQWQNWAWYETGLKFYRT